MKKLLTLCALLTCTFSIFGQTDGSSMIIAAYGQSHYNEMSATNPGQIELLEKFALQGFHVVLTNNKYETFTELTEIPLRSKSNGTVSIQDFLQAYDSGSFNPLMYGFFPGPETQVFKLHDTDRVVIIDGQSSILAQ